MYIHCFPSFKEDPEGWGKPDSGGNTLASPSMASIATKGVERKVRIPQKGAKHLWNQQPAKRFHGANTHNIKVDGVPFLGHTSRPSTINNYKTHINRWTYRT